MTGLLIAGAIILLCKDCASGHARLPRKLREAIERNRR